jgi:hypothetical protein
MQKEVNILLKLRKSTQKKNFPKHKIVKAILDSHEAKEFLPKLDKELFGFRKGSKECGLARIFKGRLELLDNIK